MIGFVNTNHCQVDFTPRNQKGPFLYLSYYNLGRNMKAWEYALAHNLPTPLIHFFLLNCLSKEEAMGNFRNLHHPN